MLDIYNDAVEAENVLLTCDVGTMRLEVESDGVARLITEEGPDYGQDYGWNDDDGGDDRSGGGNKSRRSVPPAVPRPGYEQTPQRGLRRDRYGA